MGSFAVITLYDEHLPVDAHIKGTRTRPARVAT